MNTLGKGNPLLPRCSPQDAASSCRLNASVLVSTNPGADKLKAEEKANLFIFFLFNSFFTLAPTTLHCLGPQKHLPCSTCFFGGWDKLQGT